MKSRRWQTKNLNYIILLLFVFTLLNSVSAFAGPSRTTYQAKIVKPDGYPLESSNVNFLFSILDPTGCKLYSETFSAVNMGSSLGLVSFSLGSGIRTYPVSGSTFEQVFSNTTASLPCVTGVTPGTYSPLANDARRIIMQFNDGSGWQTLPAMTINAVPYAMYANDSLKFSGQDVTDFVQVASLPTCSSNQAMNFDGVGFTCVTAGTGAVSSAAVVSALGYTPANGASVTALSSSLGTTNSAIASVSSSVFTVSSTVTSLQSSVAASFAAITSSQWTTSGSMIVYGSGNIIVSGSLQISMDSAVCSTSLAGTLRYNSGLVEYCNGTSWSAFGVAGAGITNFNGSASGAQTLTNSLTGTTPAFVTANGVHTLNIPYASAATTTAGLISNSEYALFSTVINKLTSSAASIAEVLGYTPADSAGVSTLSSTVSSLSTALTASFTSVASDISSVSGSVNTLAGTVNSVSAAVTSLTSAVSGGNFRASNGTEVNPSYSFASASGTGFSQSSNQILVSTGGVGRFNINAIGITGLNVGNPLINTDGNFSTTPPYSFVGDSQTGMYRATAGVLGFTVTGAERIRVTSSAVGINTTTPRTALDVSGGIRIGTESSACATLLAGTIRYNSGNVEYCNGTSWSAFGLAGAGITNINGSVSGSQTFANSLTGTAPAFATANGVHTLNIPYASAATTTAGLISNSDFLNFSNKIASSAASIAQVLGYTPANDASVTTINSNLATVAASFTAVNSNFATVATSFTTLSSDMASSFSAITSSQWVNNGTRISYSGGNVGVGTSAPAVNLDVIGTFRVSAATSAATNIELGNMIFGSLNPGASTANGGYIQGPANASLVVDLRNNQSDDAFAIRYSASNTGIVDNIAMVVNGQGKVGIGTSAPTRALEVVQGDTAVELGAFINSTSSTSLTDGALVRIHNTSPSNNKSVFRLGKRNAADSGFNYGDYRLNNTGDLEFAVGTGSPSLQVPEMMLSSAGNLGIGTSTTPAASRLHLYDSNPVLLTIERSNNLNTLIEYKNVSGSMYTGLINGSANWGVGTGTDLGSAGVFQVTNSGRVYIGGPTAPTARLHITPGTSSVAPVKLGLGILLTSPQAGSIEYDGSYYYITDNSGIRRTIATASTAGTLNDINTVSSTSGIVLWPASGNSVTVSSTVASTNSSTGALIVNGGAGISGALNVGGAISGSALIRGTGYRANQGAPDAADSSTNGYAFGADGDTGIFAPGSGAAGGILAFYLNNSERMRLNPSGLGINIAPTAPLQIASDTARTKLVLGRDDNSIAESSMIKIDAAGSASYTAAVGFTSGGNQNTGGAIWRPSSTGGLFFKALTNFASMGTTAAVPDLFVDPSGNVTVGSSTATYKFTVTKAFNGISSQTSVFLGGTDAATANTGLYVVQKDNIGLGTNTTLLLNAVHNDVSRMVLTGAGNMGIGTSSPSKKLTLSRPTEAVTGQLEMRTEGGITDGNFDGIYFTQGAAGATPLGSMRVKLRTSGAPDLSFFTRDLGFNTESERMTILNNGNVGVGITAPTQKLHVSGTGLFADKLWSSYGNQNVAGYSWTDAAFTTNSIEIVNNNSADPTKAATLAFHTYGYGGPQFRLDSTGSKVLYLESSGANSSRVVSAYGGGPNSYFTRLHVDGQISTSSSVGINNSSPQAELHVGRQLAVPGTSGIANRVIIQPYGHTGGPWKIDARDVAGNAFLDFMYGATNTMTFKDGGNVGIGVTNPTERLTMASSIRSESAASDTNLSRIPASNEIVLETAGNGTTSSWLWREKWAASNYGIFHDNATDHLRFVGNNTARLSVGLSNGYVGVGTSAPTATLHVEGSTRIVDGNQAAGRVLASDASGNASWKQAIIHGTIASNSATSDGTSRVGTGVSITLPPGRWLISGMGITVPTASCRADFGIRNTGTNAIIKYTLMPAPTNDFTTASVSAYVDIASTTSYDLYIISRGACTSQVHSDNNLWELTATGVAY